MPQSVRERSGALSKSHGTGGSGGGASGGDVGGGGWHTSGIFDMEMSSSGARKVAPQPPPPHMRTRRAPSQPGSGFHGRSRQRLPSVATGPDNGFPQWPHPCSHGLVRLPPEHVTCATPLAYAAMCRPAPTRHMGPRSMTISLLARPWSQPHVRSPSTPHGCETEHVPLSSVVHVVCCGKASRPHPACDHVAVSAPYVALKAPCGAPINPPEESHSRMPLRPSRQKCFLVAYESGSSRGGEGGRDGRGSDGDGGGGRGHLEGRTYL